MSNFADVRACQIFSERPNVISDQSFYSSVDNETHCLDGAQAGLPQRSYPSNFLCKVFALNFSTLALALSDSHRSMLVRRVERILKKPYIRSL